MGIYFKSRDAMQKEDNSLLNVRCFLNFSSNCLLKDKRRHHNYSRICWIGAAEQTTQTPANTLWRNIAIKTCFYLETFFSRCSWRSIHCVKSLNALSGVFLGLSDVLSELNKNVTVVRLQKDQIGSVHICLFRRTVFSVVYETEANRQHGLLRFVLWL